MELVDVDVKQLAPPEPMTVILTALAQLTSEQCLLVSHRRQPFPLYEKLQQTGWAYHCEVHGDDHISLYIYREKDQQLFEHHFTNKTFQ
jgi:uncharacterized protein (DUF2249 family)